MSYAVFLAGFDGAHPAPGTTLKNAAIPIPSPPVVGDVKRRHPLTYAAVLNQFAVGNNPRYTPRDPDGDGRENTFCNIFVWDATRAMGAEVPHWVDASGNPCGVGKGRELNANGVCEWLRTHGPRFGWREVKPLEAQAMANLGHPVVAAWSNPKPKSPGHVAMVRPAAPNPAGPTIAQAGGRNFNVGLVHQGFGDKPVTYYVNDTGVAVGDPEGNAPLGSLPAC